MKLRNFIMSLAALFALSISFAFKPKNQPLTSVSVFHPISGACLFANPTLSPDCNIEFTGPVCTMNYGGYIVNTYKLGSSMCTIPFRWDE